MLLVNTMKGEIVEEILGRVVVGMQGAMGSGEWRVVKLYTKFLGGLQGVFEGEGVWSFLQDLLTKAVDLQTENNEEVGFPELDDEVFEDADANVVW